MGEKYKGNKDEFQMHMDVDKEGNPMINSGCATDNTEGEIPSPTDPPPVSGSYKEEVKEEKKQVLRDSLKASALQLITPAPDPGDLCFIPEGTIVTLCGKDGKPITEGDGVSGLGKYFVGPIIVLPVRISEEEAPEDPSSVIMCFGLNLEGEPTEVLAEMGPYVASINGKHPYIFVKADNVKPLSPGDVIEKLGKKGGFAPIQKLWEENHLVDPKRFGCND